MSSTAAKNFLKKVNNPYSKGSHLHFAWENGFNEGFDSGLCIPCFSEEDMIEFSIWRSTNNTQEFHSCEDVREQLNLWKQSKI